MHNYVTLTMQYFLSKADITFWVVECLLDLHN